MPHAQPKPEVVAHYCDQYLPPTQTFMYSVISSLRRVQPHVISHSPAINLDRFPLPAGSVSAVLGDRYSPRWWIDGMRRKLWGEASLRETYLARCQRILADHRCQLIHAHFGHVGYEMLPLRRRMGLPLVTNFYGSDTAKEIPSIPGWPAKRAELFCDGDLFLVEGPHMRRRLLELGCSEEKIAIQRIGLRLDALPPRQPASSGPPVILFAGRFVEKKGLLDGLEAVATLLRRGRQLAFRIIGDGPQMPEARRLAQGLDSIRFLGSMDYSGYLRELAAADLFLAPSVTASNGDTEGGAPTTILEAQGLGIPVVATRHADIPNVTSPESAVLVAEHDPAALAEALEGLLLDRSRWKTMGDSGRAWIAAHHDIDQEIAHLEDLYFRLMGNPRNFPDLTAKTTI